MPGVTSVEPDPVARKVKVTFDDGKASLDNVVEALKKAGFSVQGDPVREPSPAP